MIMFENDTIFEKYTKKGWEYSCYKLLQWNKIKGSDIFNDIS